MGICHQTSDVDSPPTHSEFPHRDEHRVEHRDETTGTYINGNYSKSHQKHIQV